VLRSNESNKLGNFDFLKAVDNELRKKNEVTRGSMESNFETSKFEKAKSS
jgi:predicted translin family RNA/ssDNA-binding protein